MKSKIWHLPRVLSGALVLLLTGVLSASASIVIVNGLAHEHTIGGSKMVQGSITIQNVGAETARVQIYLSDLEHSCNGETSFDSTHNRKRCLVNWLELSDNELILTPGESTNLTYGLNPPDSIEKAGSYWGVIMIGEVENLDTALPKVGLKINWMVRFAIQIIGNYRENAIKEIDFAGVRIDTSTSTNTVRVSIQNNGNYMMKPVMVLELFDQYGNQVCRKEIPYQKLYPGYCRNFDIPIGDVPVGVYSGILVADCGEENIYGVNIELDIPQKKGL